MRASQGQARSLIGGLDHWTENTGPDFLLYAQLTLPFLDQNIFIYNLYFAFRFPSSSDEVN